MSILNCLLYFNKHTFIIALDLNNLDFGNLQSPLLYTPSLLVLVCTSVLLLRNILIREQHNKQFCAINTCLFINAKLVCYVFSLMYNIMYNIKKYPYSIHSLKFTLNKISKTKQKFSKLYFIL